MFKVNLTDKRGKKEIETKRKKNQCLSYVSNVILFYFNFAYIIMLFTINKKVFSIFLGIFWSKRAYSRRGLRLEEHKEAPNFF